MTYQAPGGQQPEGTPAYAQPQDPWAGGYEQGVASVPTDPIPQQYDPYPHGLVPGGVWTQETELHGAPYGYAPAPPRSRTGLFLLVFLLVVVLGGGGGFAAWWIISNPGNQTPPTTTPSTSTNPQSTAPQVIANCPISNASGAFDPCSVEVGDCLFNQGTDDLPDIKTSACSVAKSFKVIKISRGVSIEESPDGKFDQSTSVTECKDTGYEAWYGYQDALDDNKDVFFCLTKN
jgi:hypothetical protein